MRAGGNGFPNRGDLDGPNPSFCSLFGGDVAAAMEISKLLTPAVVADFFGSTENRSHGLLRLRPLVNRRRH